MKPIQLKHMKRTNCWQPKGKVWFQKNDDNKLAKEEREKERKERFKEKIHEDVERRNRQLEEQGEVYR